MRARLFPTTNSRASSPIVLDAFPVFLGIGENAQLQVSAQNAAEHQCQIHLEDGTLVAIDLDSPAGTWVNGESIERSPLMPGDKLHIGKNALVVSYERLTRSPPPDVLFRPVSDIAFAGEVGS